MTTSPEEVRLERRAEQNSWFLFKGVLEGLFKHLRKRQFNSLFLQSNRIPSSWKALDWQPWARFYSLLTGRQHFGNITLCSILAMTWKEVRTKSLNPLSQLILPQSSPTRVLGRGFGDLDICGETFWWALEQPWSLTWFRSPVTLLIPWPSWNFHCLDVWVIENKIKIQTPLSLPLLYFFSEKISVKRDLIQVDSSPRDRTQLHYKTKNYPVILWSCLLGHFSLTGTFMQCKYIYVYMYT